MEPHSRCVNEDTSLRRKRRHRTRRGLFRRRIVGRGKKGKQDEGDPDTEQGDPMSVLKEQWHDEYSTQYRTRFPRRKMLMNALICKAILSGASRFASRITPSNPAGSPRQLIPFRVRSLRTPSIESPAPTAWNRREHSIGVGDWRRNSLVMNPCPLAAPKYFSQFCHWQGCC